MWRAYEITYLFKLRVFHYEMANLKIVKKVGRTL